MITILNVLGTIAAIVLNVSILVGFPTYAIRARRDGYPARHRALENSSTMVRLPVIDSPELRAARAHTESLAQGIEARARLWDLGPELVRYEQSAGSVAYLDLTDGSLGRSRAELDERITTAEMRALFGVPDLEPVAA